MIRKKHPIIKRTVFALLAACICLACSACGGNPTEENGVPSVGGLKYESTVPLKYADQFDIYRFEGGYSLIDLHESDTILVVPEGKDPPDGLDDDIVVIRKPLENIYLAATSAMALFDSIDALDAISFAGSDKWYIDSAEAALESGDMVYAGKYSAPDYEMLIDGGCRLAIQSTMILHTPEVREKLIELGISTIVERSSYEDHPLGRTEWVKVYGALLGKETEAEVAFEKEAAMVSELESLDPTGKTAAFFYVNAAGNVVTYKYSGYVPAMIRIAGGIYVPADAGADNPNKLSTVNMSMEEFYNSAKDADFIIYSCSIASQLHSMDELLELSPVLENFKAVKNGNAWCTTESMFQQTDKMGTIINEMNMIFTGQADSLRYMFRLD